MILICPGPGQGGSGTTSALGTAVSNASDNLEKKIVDVVKENSFFHTEKIHEADLKILFLKMGISYLHQNLPEK